MLGFSYAGVEGATLMVTRAELAARDWSVTVPEGFAERMEAAGLAPSG